MDTKTVIYGCSDDLIEVEGEISEEANHWNAKNVSISCSDGTKAKIGYDGNWHITVKECGPLFQKIVNGNPKEDPHEDEDCKNVPGYSDALVLLPGLTWVKVGRRIFRAQEV